VAWLPVRRQAPVEEDPISTPFGLVAIILLVLANGFFVATEFALVSVRRTRIQQLATEGSARARSVLGLLNHLDMYIAATQLGITMSSIALGFIGAALGGWIANQLELPPLLEIQLGGGSAFPTVYAVMGSALFVAVLGLFRGRREDDWGPNDG